MKIFLQTAFTKLFKINFIMDNAFSKSHRAKRVARNHTYFDTLSKMEQRGHP